MTTQVLVDRTSNIIANGERAIRLSPTEFLLFMMLWAEHPKGVPAQRLEHNFYRMRLVGGGVTRQCLSVHLHNFEKKIEPLKLKLWRTKKIPRSYGLKEVCNETA